MKRIKTTGIVLAGIIQGGCLFGCQAAKVENFEQAKQFIALVSQEAGKQGAAWYVDIEWSGSPEAYQRTAIGLDLGLRAKAHIMGNAAAGRSPNPSSDATPVTLTE